MERRPSLALAALVALTPMLGAMDGCAPAPPPRPEIGPGSTEGYIASSVATFEAGEVTASDSTKVTWFVPDVLRDGSSAPVVLFLHGFSAGAPGLYDAHIDHIALQGNIVVFPHFNARNAFADLDQNVMVDRIVANAQTAYDALGATADLSQLYVYGHSAGAAFGSVLEHNGSVVPVASVLAHPSVGTETIPVPIEIEEVDFAVEAASTTTPVVILTGEPDAIAPPAQAVLLQGYLTGAPSAVVWQAFTDETGNPALTPSHLAPLSGADSLDWRFYWSALDQVMAGDTDPLFDFGAWSDGTPVTAPVVLAD